jgi:hypothetical protein
VSVSSLTIFAYTSDSRLIDNDSIDLGYSNINNGFTYITSSSLYNGDARYSVASATNNSYYWTYPGISAGNAQYFDIEVKMYLAHSSFTDTAPEYYVQISQSGYCYVGSVNQNTAPNGWSTIDNEDVSTLYADGGILCQKAYVEPSGLYNKGTGADALQVKVSYGS